MTNKQAGNVLFLILIAVALFAALAYAITSSSRGTGGTISPEKAKIGAANILQFFSALDTALMKMQIAASIPIQNISFEHYMKTHAGNGSINQINGNCTTNACRVFMPSGGGIIHDPFKAESVAEPSGWGASWLAPGSIEFDMMQFPGAKTSANDIVARIMAVKPEICVEIWKTLCPTASFPNVGGSWFWSNVPSTWDNSGITVSNLPTGFEGHTTFVTGSNTGGNGQYCDVYHLAIAR